MSFEYPWEEWYFGNRFTSVSNRINVTLVAARKSLVWFNNWERRGKFSLPNVLSFLEAYRPDFERGGQLT